jgi:hypothetical protein
VNGLIERRQPDRSADEALSPEYLRVLEICGGEIRESDRAALAERHKANRAPERADADPATPDTERRGLTS